MLDWNVAAGGDEFDEADDVDIPEKYKQSEPGQLPFDVDQLPTALSLLSLVGQVANSIDQHRRDRKKKKKKKKKR